MTHGMGEPTRYRWLMRSIQAFVLSVLMAIAITWTGVVYDHPVNAAITAGMTAPECADVRRMPAGSLLMVAPPESDICRSFFLYRTALPDAADDVRSYVRSVKDERVDEFRLLIGYVWVLSFATVGIAFMIGSGVHAAYARYRRGRRQPERQRSNPQHDDPAIRRSVDSRHWRGRCPLRRHQSAVDED